MFDVIIVGAGPSGMAAAVYCLRQGLSVIILEKLAAGGQMATTGDIENYPAFDRINGFDLAQKMSSQVKGLGGTIKSAEVLEYDLCGDIKKIKTRREVLESKAVILCMGAMRRRLGIPGEEELASKGVSYCATCDGFFFKDKICTVVGGGETAVSDALYLADICSKVYLIHRRDSFRAAEEQVKRVAGNDKITVLYDTVPIAAEGGQILEWLTVKNVKTGTLERIKTDGMFVAVGTVPNTEKLKGIIGMDDGGYILSGEDCKTDIDGVFAAGDLRKKPLRQIVTALSDGAVSAVMAGEYIRQK